MVNYLQQEVNQMLDQAVIIKESHDTITIYANGTKFFFDKDDPFDRLVDVFKELGINDVKYEEIY